MLKKLFILLFCVVPTLAFAQPVQQQVYSRERDAVNPAAVKNVERPDVDDKIPGRIYAADEMGLMYCLDAGGNWDRQTCTVAGDAIAADAPGLTTTSLLHWYDATAATLKFRRLSGSVLVDDYGSAVIPSVPFVGAFPMVYDRVNLNWNKLTGDAVGNLTVNQTTGFPGYGRIQDGDSTTLADVLDTFANGLAYTLNGLASMSVMYADNGATLDKLLLGALGELLIGVINWPNAFDAANAWLNSYKVGTKPYLPPKETSGVVSNVAVVVMASKTVSTYPNCCLFYRNKDAANPLTDAAVYVSPDNAGTCGDVNWVSLTWTTCDGLVATNTCVYCFSTSAYPYLCGTATAANPLTVSSVEAWLSCNPN